MNFHFLPVSYPDVAFQHPLGHLGILDVNTTEQGSACQLRQHDATEVIASSDHVVSIPMQFGPSQLTVAEVTVGDRRYEGCQRL